LLAVDKSGISDTGLPATGRSDEIDRGLGSFILLLRLAKRKNVQL
jgi:hypothetical protein